MFTVTDKSTKQYKWNISDRGDLGLKVRLMEKLCRIFSQKGHSISLLLSAYKVLWELVVVWWSYFSGESTDGSARDAESDSQ